MDHFKNFVKGEPYPGSEILVYMLIDLDDQIQKMETEIREFNPSNTIDIKAFPFDEQEGYSYLRLYDHKSTKFDAVNQLIDEYHFKMVIALGSKIFDIPMMQKADYSIALESAPDEVKKTADLVLKGSNPDVIVAQISKIFSMRNPQKLLKIRKSDEI